MNGFLKVNSNPPPPHFLFPSILFATVFLFLSSAKQDSFSDLVHPETGRLVMGVSVDEPICLSQKTSKSFKTEQLFFTSVSLMSYVFETTDTELVSFKGAIGELNGHVVGSLGVLDANAVEGGMLSGLSNGGTRHKNR